MAEVGASWDDVGAVLLTHVHGDHWHENTLAHLERRSIPLFCHPSHATALKGASPAFALLLEQDRLRFYDVDQPMPLAEGVQCRPVALKHDGDITCGFRFDGGPDRFGQTWALGYAADLGCWSTALADALANVDMLALEFNHDEWLERNSGRAPALIRRVLGDHGHLSNRQASALLAAVLDRSHARRLQHVVQLHLSRECNRPGLARRAAKSVLMSYQERARLHTAEQDYPGPWLTLNLRRCIPALAATFCPTFCYYQPWLPGWETEKAPAGLCPAGE
jgi:phosphoribosyl 1,2-cyclic phosphodiesterase